EHGQAAVPGFGEADETEAGGGVGHETLRNVSRIVKDRERFWALGCQIRVSGSTQPFAPLLMAVLYEHRGGGGLGRRGFCR
ncbi:MAG: hypothetical protein KXJ48_10655, partial [Vulcanococcus sp.]|nr:hypothetical protein [Vulcanococcus sp.]